MGRQTVEFSWPINCLIHSESEHLISSFQPDAGCRYTAWSSMGSLIKKGLVVKNSSPARLVGHL